MTTILQKEMNTSLIKVYNLNIQYCIYITYK